MNDVLTPNSKLKPNAWKVLLIGQIVTLAIVWLNSPFALLPQPGDVWHSFSDLWMKGLGTELVTSFKLNLTAIFWATLISLGLSYLTVMPFFRPVVALYSKLRFLSLIGLTFFFTMVVANPHQLKVSVLVFSISVFFVTSMLDVLSTIPQEQFDLARTLRMKEWRVVYEVVILGQLHAAWDVMRQNAAIGWMMLTMVEGLVRSEGGIGTMLLDQNRHFRLSGIFAIQATILLVGLAQDYAFAWLKSFLFHYSTLTTVKK